MNPMQGNAAMSFVPPIQGDASEELWVCEFGWMTSMVDYLWWNFEGNRRKYIHVKKPFRFLVSRHARDVSFHQKQAIQIFNSALPLRRMLLPQKLRRKLPMRRSLYWAWMDVVPMSLLGWFKHPEVEATRKRRPKWEELLCCSDMEI